MVENKVKSSLDARETGVLGEIIFKGKYGVKEYYLDINSSFLAKKYQKEQGAYTTLNVSKIFCTNELARKYVTSKIVEILKNYISKLKIKSPTFLVVGLGNAFLIADSLGAMVVKNLLATHNIPSELRDSLGDLCALIPGVSGINGFATADIVLGAVNTVRPNIVIVIDALTAREPARIGCSFQFSNTGISPGAGIGSKNQRLNKNFLGADIISIGVPMMINASNLGSELTDFVVTPKEIDIYTKNCAKVIASAINEVVHTKRYKDFL